MKKRILQLCAVAVLGLSGSVNAQSITADFTAPVTEEAGATFTSSFTYTVASSQFYQIIIWKASDPTIFGSGVTQEFVTAVDGTLAAGTDATQNFSIMIPMDATPTVDLTAPNDKYYLFGKITSDLSDNTGGSDLASWNAATMGNYPELVVTASTLSVDNFNVVGESASIFVKQSSKTLEITKSLGSDIRIVDMAGRNVMTIDANNSKSIDLSSLRSGFYMAMNDSSSFKFAL